MATTAPASSPAAHVPTRRIRQNTSLAAMPMGTSLAGDSQQAPLAHWTVEENILPEDATRTKQVYLVTPPALVRSGSNPNTTRECPSTWSHADVARVVLDVFQRPVHTARNRSWGTKRVLEMFVVFRERPAPHQ